VSFKFKPDATEQQVAALIEAFEGLQNEIPQILSFEWGLNNSPEGFDRGMTHVFLLTFENETARDEYLPHPAHKAFGDTHGGIIEDLVVVDYTINE
jgi:5,10-methylenetetrahydrofolate reductase